MENKGIVLVLTNKISGLHSFRKEVIKAIIDDGFEVYISEPDDDERVKYFESIGCHIIKTAFNRRGMNPLADLKLMMTYRKMILQLKPAVVLSYTIKPNVYGGMACRLTHTPQLANVTGLGDAIENGGWLQKLTVALYKKGIGKAKKVFFQNQSNRNLCISFGIANDDSVLLPGSGVNLQHHTIQPYPVDKGKVRFLFIGRLLKDKGIQEYFEAARRVKAKYPNAVFQILGRVDGPYQSELDELIKEGIVIHFGETTDVRTYLRDVECTVMPSYHEGMSNVNLESAANGRPVITTDVPGCRETVDDGITGFYVDAKNADSLAEAMEKFITLPYKQKVMMGEAARKKVEKEFDRQIVVNEYLSEIKSISNKTNK
ncbi:MAG: glycosyltransferase family 4 protein [Bacteroidaceae bacterium]|nr:glycosyltransferase family 4 protein [Bacteroidaceae bacterium]